jgi:hypothetical protein
MFLGDGKASSRDAGRVVATHDRIIAAHPSDLVRGETTGRHTGR